MSTLPLRLRTIGSSNVGAEQMATDVPHLADRCPRSIAAGGREGWRRCLSTFVRQKVWVITVPSWFPPRVG